MIVEAHDGVRGKNADIRNSYWTSSKMRRSSIEYRLWIRKLRPNDGESQQSLDRLPIVGVAVELGFPSMIGEPHVEQ